MSFTVRLNDPITKKQLADLKRRLKLREDAIIALAIASLWAGNENRS
jgi:hypothetical protein